MNKGIIPNNPDFEEIDYNLIEVDDYRIEDIGDFMYEEAYVMEVK